MLSVLASCCAWGHSGVQELLRAARGRHDFINSAVAGALAGGAVVGHYQGKVPPNAALYIHAQARHTCLVCAGVLPSKRVPACLMLLLA